MFQFMTVSHCGILGRGRRRCWLCSKKKKKIERIDDGRPWVGQKCDMEASVILNSKLCAAFAFGVSVAGFRYFNIRTAYATMLILGTSYLYLPVLTSEDFSIDVSLDT
jgi:hypothetical protein